MSGSMREINIPPAVQEIHARLESEGFETWCVGGAVRDSLLGHDQSDVDLATAATPADVQRIFRRTIPVGIDHGTVGVLDDSDVLHEVTTFRRDVSTDGRHAVVQFGVSLDDDLARRDFTINAIAWHPVRHEWRDPFDGRGDIGRKLVRAVGDPDERFREDRLRIFRAMRFAARFEFTIDPRTWQAARSHAADTRDLSAERVREEWCKGIASISDRRLMIEMWNDSGVADVWVPAEWVRETRVGESVPSDPVLALAWWRRPVEPILRRLKFSRADIQRGQLIDRGPHYPNAALALNVRRWLAQVGPAADDLRMLARGEPGAAIWLKQVDAIRSRREPTSLDQLELDGNDLMAAGVVQSGPAMGRLLSWLLAQVVEEPALNERERLLELARSWPG